MRKHPVRKFLGLFVLYAAVIIGIFVLQFKTQSVFSQTLKKLTVTLYQNEDENHLLHLKNQFQAEFNGVVLFSDETSAATAYTAGSKTAPLTLNAWEKTDSDFRLSFEEGVELIFTPEQTDNSAEMEMSVKTVLPVNYTAIRIPYRLTSSVTMDSLTKNRLVMFTNNGSFAFNAAEFTDRSLTLTKTDSTGNFAPYDPVQKFTFEAVAGVPKADAETYNQTLAAVRTNVISKTEAILSSTHADTLSEIEIAAYVAEMGHAGKFNEAIDSIPASFKTGNKRTYFTAPYFNTLQRMNENLEMQTDNLISMIDNATSTGNADIFNMEGISDFIIREKKSRRVHTLLTTFQTMADFEPNLVQATAILNVYNDILPHAQDRSAMLEPILETCISVIESSCSLKDDVFTLEYNGVPASTIQYAESGTALLRTGNSLSRPELKNTGRLIINTALENAATLDSKTLAQIYPLLIKDNKFYPHTEILGWYGPRAAWAWTCASSISYALDEDGTANIQIDFPQGLTNYIIFKGIPTFHAKIEIQGLLFRTDPRFETYNSSGYVYNTDTGTLLLKSRHKSQKETVRLYCDPTSSFTKN